MSWLGRASGAVVKSSPSPISLGSGGVGGESPVGSRQSMSCVPSACCFSQPSTIRSSKRFDVATPDPSRTITIPAQPSPPDRKTGPLPVSVACTAATFGALAGLSPFQTVPSPAHPPAVAVIRRSSLTDLDMWRFYQTRFWSPRLIQICRWYESCKEKTTRHSSPA